MLVLQLITLNDRHTVGRTPLVEGSDRRRNLYTTTFNTEKTQPFFPPAGLEPAIPANEWPQTHALDSAATAIGHIDFTLQIQTDINIFTHITTD
jgi:hypothetical protein